MCEPRCGYSALVIFSRSTCRRNRVAVEYDNVLYNPGEVLSVTQSEAKVDMMLPTTSGMYRWPRKKYVLFYNFNKIGRKIQKPSACDSTTGYFIVKDI